MCASSNLIDVTSHPFALPSPLYRFQAEIHVPEGEEFKKEEVEAALLKIQHKRAKKIAKALKRAA